jgi:HSP20 family protein
MSTTTLARKSNGTLPTFFMDDFFTPSFFDLDFFPTFKTGPQVDINYNDENITLDMVLAGIPKENIKVEVGDGKLMIEATKDDTEIKKAYTLPDTVDGENISAKYENGVLNVVLPKSVKVKNTKLIDIK